MILFTCLLDSKNVSPCLLSFGYWLVVFLSPQPTNKCIDILHKLINDTGGVFAITAAGEVL